MKLLGFILVFLYQRCKHKDGYFPRACAFCTYLIGRLMTFFLQGLGDVGSRVFGHDSIFWNCRWKAYASCGGTSRIMYTFSEKRKLITQIEKRRVALNRNQNFDYDSRPLPSCCWNRRRRYWSQNLDRRNTLFDDISTFFPSKFIDAYNMNVPSK